MYYLHNIEHIIYIAVPPINYLIKLEIDSFIYALEINENPYHLIRRNQ